MTDLPTALVRLPVLALAFLLAALGPAPRPAAQAHGDEHLGLTAGYRLVETWQDRAWQPEPFHFGDAGDVASSARGTFVLDRRQNALHLRPSSGGEPRRIVNPAEQDPGAPWRWIRLDTGADGQPHLLARGVFEGDVPEEREVRYRIDRLALGAQGPGSYELTHVELGAPAPERYVDLAVGPQGQVYVVRTNGNVASRGDVSYAVDVIGPGAAGERTIETWRPESLYIPLQIEVDAEGAIYLIDQFPHTSQNQPPGTVDGIHVYEPDRSPREVVQFSGAMDIALGPDGARYVTRNREIYRLGQERPFFVGPPIQKNPYALTPLGVPEMFSLDVAPDGRVQAVMSHCSWQGLLAFDAQAIAAGEPGTLIERLGALDAPELAGPLHPFRIDADRDVRLLQARYAVERWQAEGPPAPGQGPGPRRPEGVGSQLYAGDPQSLQRWTGGGALAGQAGACGVWNAPYGVRDLAVDGEDAWTLDFQAIKRRGPDPLARPGRQLELEPEPTFGFEIVEDLLATPQLLALSADGGEAAVLDAGSQSVSLVGRDMQRRASWSYRARADDSWAPTDIALRGDLVALAARGERRVTVFDRQGEARGLWWEARPVRALAIGPAETVFVLTDGGWLLRRAADGEHMAMWRLPDLSVSPRDLAVDLAGRVYVPWARLDPVASAALDPSQRSEVEDAGVWVFQPSEAYQPPEPGFVAKLEQEQGGEKVWCYLVAGKLAIPQAPAPGQAVEVALSLESECAPADRGLRLVVIVDSSKSMNNDNALDRAKQALVDLIGRLDPISATEVAIVAYDGAGGAALLAPFAEDLDAARRAVAERTAAGETGLGTALVLAAGLIEDAGADGEAAVLWATDGETLSPGDDAAPGLQLLREAGVPVYAQLHPFRAIRDSHLQALRGLVEAGRIFTQHGPEGLDAQVDALYRRSGSGSGPAFESLRITDTLAEGMAYEEGSSEPPAIWDPATRRLTWLLTEPPAGRPVQLSYRVQPDAIGSWIPLSESATARYELDGHLGLVGFPNPTLHLRSPGQALLPGLWRGAAE